MPVTAQNQLLERIATHAANLPDQVALEGASMRLGYAELDQAIGETAEWLRHLRPQALGLLLDNGPQWALLDLAALAAGIPVVPLPGFFSASQLAHTLRDAGVDLVVTDTPARLAGLDGIADEDTPSADTLAGLHVLRRAAAGHALPGGVAKITYTSGTTGEPKGVCLGLDAIERVAASLVSATEMTPADRHLSVLPLATLLENIGGLYAPLLAGATCVLQPLVQLGLRGATGLDIERFFDAFNRHGASTTILIPQMLQALTEYAEATGAGLTTLRFAAVGGAPVSPALLARGTAAGLPVFEGYGLSESASVVAVNTAASRRAGSVGRPLPHVRVRFSEAGELFVSGASFLGYLGQPAASDDAGDPDHWIETGDIGHLDDAGYLHITGRRKHMFITSFGRNVSPEWVERELTLQAAIAQAAVFGEARPYNVAVIVRAPGASDAAVNQAVALANQGLPDYAQVGRWIEADAPFSLDNDQLTATLRLRRRALWAHYGTRIEAVYEPSMQQEELRA